MEQAFRLFATRRLLRLYRVNDRRQAAADGYRDLVSMWQRSELTPSSLGLSANDYMLRRVGDTLWAARYRALVRDYKLARNYVREALSLIKNLKTARPNGAKSVFRKELAVLEAEAQYVLAHRIAIEQKDYQTAFRAVKQGLTIKPLPSHWQRRFSWTLGLYRFVVSDYRGAIEVWSALFDTEGLPSSWRAKLLFWRAAAYQELGEHGSSLASLQTLRAQYPLNFYSVVGISLLKTSARMEHATKLKLGLKIPRKPKRRYHLKAGKYQAAAKSLLLYDPYFRRIDVMLKLGFHSWSRASIQHHYRRAKKSWSQRSNVELFIRFAKLLSEVGSYPASISLLTNLQEVERDFWKNRPELVHIYFPLPFHEIIRSKATKYALDVSIPYAIARQESAFNKDARSHADAKGLMQLIAPTAKRISTEVGIALSPVPASFISLRLT